MVKSFILGIALLLATVVVAQEEKPVTPQIGISIPLGDTVIIEDIHIKFLEVLEDSRCPKDVQCVWAGQAKVKVAVSKDGIDPQQLELLFKNTLSTPIIEMAQDFTIKGLALTPYPTAKTQGKLAYALMVRKFPKQ